MQPSLEWGTSESICLESEASRQGRITMVMVTRGYLGHWDAGMSSSCADAGSDGQGEGEGNDA